MNKYQPDERPAEAVKALANAMADASKELDLQRHLAVDRAADALTEVAWITLSQSLGKEGLPHPTLKTMGEAFAYLARSAAIQQLLEMGAIRAAYTTVTPNYLMTQRATGEGLVRYRQTEFGKAMFQRILTRSGTNSPETIKYLKALAAQSSKPISDTPK